MLSLRIEESRRRLEPLRTALLAHPVYRRIDGIDALRVFMEYHVYAVWDFMSLLKALQRRLCSVDLPWVPPSDPASCRLINEIVLGEESDEDGQGGFCSHFDLYRHAMRECGADTRPIDRFVESVRSGQGVLASLEAVDAPEPVQRFVAQTFAIIKHGDINAIAAAFTFGREDLLPDVFRRIVEELASTPDCDTKAFRYYLDRHIAVDSGEHGPMAWRLLERLCGDDPAKWQLAEEAALQSLDSRLALWDAVSDRLEAIE
jgi:hypothetical protein